MLIYDDVEQLVSDMFRTIEVDEDVISVVADKNLVLEIMQEMHTYENVNIYCCNIDDFAYDRDKEYFISLYYDDDDECWYVCVGQAYNIYNNKYVGMGGYVLFHEDVNSKALIDMQNNKMSFLTGHDWFVIGEDDSFKSCDEDVTDENTNVVENENKSVKPATSSKYIYRVNDKEVDKETYDKVSSELDLLLYDAFKDIINEFIPRRLRFFW